MPVTKKPFQFHSLSKGLPDAKEALRQLAFFAHAQFLADGGEVTVCPPAFAAGCETPSAVRQAIWAGR